MLGTNLCDCGGCSQKQSENRPYRRHDVDTRRLLKRRDRFSRKLPIQNAKTIWNSSSFFRLCEFSSGDLQSPDSISFLILIRYSLTHSLLVSVRPRSGPQKFADTAPSFPSADFADYVGSLECARTGPTFLSRRIRSAYRVDEVRATK